MIQTNIYEATQAHSITAQMGQYSVLEYQKDLSVSADHAQTAFFMSQMGVHKRQVVVNLNNSGTIVQAGAMQWMAGNIEAVTNIKGAGDAIKKLMSAKVTGETVVKPRYRGTGTLVLEPTYKHIILTDLSAWGGAMVIEDGLFLACDESVDLSVVARTNLSSAMLGGEGLFNTCMKGSGVAVLESPFPADELIVVDLENDVIKIDGNFAICWSPTLQFTVEKTTKTLVGSAASGEGFVNVYRGTGRVLMAPVG